MAKRFINEELLDKLYVVAHGSKDNQAYHHYLKQKFSAYQALQRHYDIQLCYAKAAPCFSEIIGFQSHGQRLVLPFFMSDGYIVEKYIVRAIEALSHDNGNICLLQAIGQSPDNALAIEQALLKYCLNIPDLAAIFQAGASWSCEMGSIGLALVGHGSSLSQSNHSSIETIAAQLRNNLPLMEVRTFYLEQEPFFQNWSEHFESSTILALPLMLTIGHHIKHDILGRAERTYHGHNKTIHYLPAYVELVEFENMILQAIRQTHQEEVR